MNELKYSINQICLIFKSKDSKKIGNLVKDILIFGLILCFLKLPFVMFRDIVVDYFNKISMDGFLGVLFYWLFDFFILKTI